MRRFHWLLIHAFALALIATGCSSSSLTVGKEYPLGVECTGASPTCSCKVSNTPNATPCSTEGFEASAICCAPYSWPTVAHSSTSACTCRERTVTNVAYACTNTSSSYCTCDKDKSGPLKACTKPTRGACCALTAYSCYCDTTRTTCTSGWTKVDTCDAAIFKTVTGSCSGSTQEVPSCSGGTVARPPFDAGSSAQGADFTPR